MSKDTQQKTWDRALGPVLAAALAGALATALAVLFAVAQARVALAQEGGNFDPESGALEIITIIGFIVLVVAIGFAVLKLANGSVVPGLLILFMGGLFYALAQDPTMIGDFGEWVLSLFGMGGGGS